VFWVTMGFAFLIKGPVTPMVAAYAGLGVWLWDKWKTGTGGDWWRVLMWWPGPLIFVVLVLPWLIWIQTATDGLYVKGAVGKDLKDKFTGASEGHGGWPGYHLIHIPAWFFPGSLLVLPAIVAVRRALTGGSLAAVGHGTAGLKMLVAWGVLTWIFFELLPTKLSHYILPAYPAFGLLCGYAALQMMDGNAMPRARFFSLLLFGAGAGALLAVSHPAAATVMRAEAAGDFQTVSGAAVLTSWTRFESFPLGLWWAGLAATVLALLTFALRRIGASIILAVLAATLIGWHIRIDMLPGQTWAQATVTAQEDLFGPCPGARAGAWLCRAVLCVHDRHAKPAPAADPA
jgi:4-amino-4-deoxy-L-arabinose transferase-like glycosyltransferase